MNGASHVSRGHASARAEKAAARSEGVDQARIPSISRKVKACAACRKQKVRTYDLPEEQSGLRLFFADQMYNAGKSTLPALQRTRTVVSPE